MTHVTQDDGLAGTVTARVPAKVNLQLSVGPLRDDGYHDLVTVFHAVSLFDEVTVRMADRTSVVVSGEGGPAVPLGPANLAVRAAVALARATGRRSKGAGGVRIEIRKRIPVAAGLAGGSADAAAALVACNELWHAGLNNSELTHIGAQIGSDVPFALTGGTAVGIGRGERLTRALVSGSYQWVLAFGATGLATPDVFAACDRLRAARGARDGEAPAVPSPKLSTELMAALRSGDPAAVGPLLTNDLSRCCGALSRRAKSTARSAPSCPARDRPARSWRPTRTPRATWPSRSRGRAYAARSSRSRAPLPARVSWSRAPCTSERAAGARCRLD